MQRIHRFTAAALLTAFMGTSLLTPFSARASEEGKRNTTYGLGAAAAGLLLTQKNKLPGLVVAGGAAVAYGQYQHSIDARHRREREAHRRALRHRRAARYHHHG